MNEERLYRGKRTDNGEWIYGYYCPCCFGYFPCRPAIIDKQEMESGCWKPVEVIPETVGQDIGKKDKNGKKTFTGDIVNYDGGQFVVHYYPPHMAYYFNGLHGRGGANGFTMVSRIYEVIGNVYDNPELLD